MDIAQVFSSLYPLVALIAFAGYVPQILQLFLTKTRINNVSV